MSTNIEVTQFPGGIGNQGDNSILASLPVPLNARAAVFFEDFMAVAGQPTLSGGWVGVLDGAGSVASNVAAARGILRITTGGAGGAGLSYFGQDALGAADPIVLSVGEPAWSAARFRSSDLLVNSLIAFGFGDEASGFSSSEAFQMRIGFGSAALTSINSLAAQTDINIIPQLLLANNTWYEVGMYWDGVDRISGQILDANGKVIAGGGGVINADFPTLALAPMFGIIDIAAGAVTLDVDWFMFASGR